MLIDDVERYVSLRRAFGYKFHYGAQQLRKYAAFATTRGDTHVTTATAIAWAEAGCSPKNRHVRMRHVVGMARFLHAEDPTHQVPASDAFFTRFHRPAPYIYSAEEIARMMAATSRLRHRHPLRKRAFATLIGLIASTGLRISEALDLRLGDIRPDGVLHIRQTKFRKSRLVPLHPTTWAALGRYLEARRGVTVECDNVFLSVQDRRISASIANWTFLRILKLADIAPGREKRPRIHDLRHTFATRALEKCPGDRRAISRHFVALATYLGHKDARSTYWYLEATPELMTDMAVAAEALMWGKTS